MHQQPTLKKDSSCRARVRARAEHCLILGHRWAAFPEERFFAERTHF